MGRNLTDTVAFKAMPKTSAGSVFGKVLLADEWSLAPSHSFPPGKVEDRLS